MFLLEIVKNDLAYIGERGQSAKGLSASGGGFKIGTV